MSARFDEEEGASPAQLARAEITELQVLIWKLPPLLREALILVGRAGDVARRGRGGVPGPGRHDEGPPVPCADGAGPPGRGCGGRGALTLALT